MALSHMKKSFPVALTFDIDWAPDFAVEMCVDILIKHNVPATFFATHPSGRLEEIKKNPLFEVGIHPNFLDGSTHGTSFESIMQYVMDLVPDACSIRTHGLYQTSGMLFSIMEKYPSITHDFSLFVAHNNALSPFNFFNEKGMSILRIPYQWEDDLYFSTFSSSPEKPFIFSQATYQIFDFHPIHVYLNSSSSELYNRVKMATGKPLSLVEERELLPFINETSGVKTWLSTILTTISKERFVKACDIAEAVK